MKNKIFAQIRKQYIFFLKINHLQVLFDTIPHVRFLFPYHLRPKIQKTPQSHPQNLTLKPRLFSLSLSLSECSNPSENVYPFLINPHLSPLQTLSPHFSTSSPTPSPHRSLLRSLVSGEAKETPKAKTTPKPSLKRRWFLIGIGFGIGGWEEPPLHLHGRAHGKRQEPRLSRRLWSHLRHDCRWPHSRPPLLPCLDRLLRSQFRSWSRREFTTTLSLSLSLFVKSFLHYQGAYAKTTTTLRWVFCRISPSPACSLVATCQIVIGLEVS